MTGFPAERTVILTGAGSPRGIGRYGGPTTSPRPAGTSG
jgi:hypothetical protein